MKILQKIAISLCLTANLLAPVNAADVVLENITPAKAQIMIAEKLQNSDFQLLDVRTEQEFVQGHIKGAKKLDFYSESFANKIARLDKEKTYLIYCRSGNRSGQTLALMKKLGFKEVYNMTGGVMSWYQQKLPLVLNNPS